MHKHLISLDLVAKSYACSFYYLYKYEFVSAKTLVRPSDYKLIFLVLLLKIS